MDQQRLQHGLDVHRAFYCLCGRADGAAENFILCGDGFYVDLRIPSADPQLQLADCGARFGRVGVGHVLPAYADLRAAKYSSAVPSVYDSAVRDFRGWSRKHRSIALRLVPGSSVLALDVLEFGGDHTVDGALHLFRHTLDSCAKEIGRAAEFYSFSVRQPGIRDAVRRVRSRGKARLVAIGSVQRIVLRRLNSSGGGDGAASARSQPFG